MNVAGAADRRVLVVDDDVELCQLLSLYLHGEGLAVETAHNGTTGVERALSGDYAIVVLDVMLPDIKGFEVLRRLRVRSRMPVLMLTARGDEQDRILGLELGADDYLPKPFNPRELAARIEAILRRAAPDPTITAFLSAERIVVDDITMDKGTRVARQAGEELPLTTIEFNLLEVFLRSAGRVVSRESLVKAVLDRDFSPFDRSIDTHVSNLRRKLGPTRQRSERIKGVRGVGYLYALTDSHDREA